LFYARLFPFGLVRAAVGCYAATFTLLVLRVLYAGLPVPTLRACHTDSFAAGWDIVAFPFRGSGLVTWFHTGLMTRCWRFGFWFATHAAFTLPRYPFARTVRVRIGGLLPQHRAVLPYRSSLAVSAPQQNGSRAVPRSHTLLPHLRFTVNALPLRTPAACLPHHAFNKPATPWFCLRRAVLVPTPDGFTGFIMPAVLPRFPVLLPIYTTRGRFLRTPLPITHTLYPPFTGGLNHRTLTV